MVNGCDGDTVISPTQPPKKHRKPRKKRKTAKQAAAEVEEAAEVKVDETLQGDNSWASQVEEKMKEAKFAKFCQICQILPNFLPFETNLALVGGKKAAEIEIIFTVDTMMYM